MGLVFESKKDIFCSGSVGFGPSSRSRISRLTRKIQNQERADFQP